MKFKKENSFMSYLIRCILIISAVLIVTHPLYGAIKIKIIYKIAEKIGFINDGFNCDIYQFTMHDVEMPPIGK